MATVPAPVLTAARVTLRPFTAADLAAVHALWTEATLRRYLWGGALLTKAQTAEALAASNADFSSRRFGLWGVYTHGDDRLVGFCGARSGPASAPELVYGLLPEVWGQGLAAEAASAVLEYLFATLGHAEVTAAADPPNQKSVRLLERIGMSFQHQAKVDGLETLFYHVRRAAWERRRTAPPPA